MKRFLRNYWPVLMIVVVLSLMIAMPSFAASSWTQKYERFAAAAGETLTTGNVVCISGSDGYAYKADANDATLRPAVGVIGKGGATHATVEIITRGILAGQTAASPGARIYLSETAGGLTDTAPTNAQILGWVMPPTSTGTSNTVYYINVQQPVSDGAGY